MTRTGLLVALSAVFAVLGVAPSVRSAEQPNIVVVVADDMGWRDTGYQGNPDVKTPHLAVSFLGARSARRVDRRRRRERDVRD